MELEDHQEVVREGFAGAAQLTALLGWVVLGAVTCAFVVWMAWCFRNEIVASLNAQLYWRSGPASRSLALLQFLVRQDLVRKALAIAAAFGTLAVGIAAGLLQLDGEWLLKHRRFWFRAPSQIDQTLRAWAGCIKTSEPAAADICAWAARQSPNERYGRKVIEIAAQLVDEIGSKE